MKPMLEGREITNVYDFPPAEWLECARRSRAKMPKPHDKRKCPDAEWRRGTLAACLVIGISWAIMLLL
jgi:hypothetical protein